MWQRGCLGWETPRINAYARKAVIPHSRPRGEIYDENPLTNEDFNRSCRAALKPMQEINFEAMIARGLLRALPDVDRSALEILADGGDALDVAEEMGLRPSEAIETIRRARRHVGLVDPL